MDIAIVTGANTRIGLAISQKLIDIGCRVYGLGSNFNDFPLEHTDFIPVSCDLTSTKHLCQVVQEIIDKEKNIYILVNHARYMNLGAHEKQELNDLESLVHTNLLAPLILTRLALPSLIRLRGYVLNIGFPDLPGSHRLGSAFLSTEVALQQFSDRLYEEVRQDKVKVCSLILDTANVESLFKEGFTERDNHDLIVCSEATSQAVEYVISQKRDSVVSRLVVRPQKREPDIKDRDTARKIPAPKAYTSRSSAKKVVVGRLQKEVEQAPSEKGPATYMDMARELAKEEAIIERRSKEATDSPQHRRRSRRRGRNRNQSRDGQPQEVLKNDKSPVRKSGQVTESKQAVAKKWTPNKVVKKKVPAGNTALKNVPPKKISGGKPEAKKVTLQKSGSTYKAAKKSVEKPIAKRYTRNRLIRKKKDS